MGLFSLQLPYTIALTWYFFVKGDSLAWGHTCRNLHLLGNGCHFYAGCLALSAWVLDDQSDTVTSGALQVHHDGALAEDR